jgi:hypothetical protein
MAQVKLNRHLDVVLDGVLNLSVASSSATNSIHKKTQEGETTLQHTEIVAGFLRKMFYPIFIIALMTVFTSCRDDENNISSIGENYSPLMMSTFSDGNTYTLTDFTYNSNDSLIVDDYLIAQLGIAHNYYLEKFIENFDYSASDYYEEIKDGVINANIDFDKFPNNDRYSLIERYENTTEPTLENITVAINNSELPDKSTLIEYLTNINNFVENDTNNYAYKSSILDNYTTTATSVLCDISLIILKSHISVLKESLYFWLPIYKGGNGIGNSFMVVMDEAMDSKIGNTLQKQEERPLTDVEMKNREKVAQADANSFTLGFTCMVISGIIAGPGGGLVVLAAETILNVGVAALTSATTPTEINGGSKPNGGNNNNNKPGGGKNTGQHP